MREPDYPATDAAGWAAVDGYFADLLAPEDAGLRAALARNAAQGLPRIDVSTTQGKMLALFARMVGARRILEIGTLGGYSSIWMARALPADGQLVTIEADAHHAAVAADNVRDAGLADRIDIRVGAALDVLPTLVAPFDMIFIDADKPNNPHYLDWAVKLARPGAIIIGDNVVRDGAVADPHSTDPSVQGVQRFFERMHAHPRLEATALQTVGAKGYDGFSIARVID